MLFVTLTTLWMSVYPLLFRNGLPWIALGMLVVTLACALLCTLLFWKIRRLCGLIGFAFFCWILYLTVLLLGCMLHL
jgi:hypothetical protein